ncbi:hypothetical protein LCGC14_0720810 [marine sediment metagenome]|uniref:Uncharacterized protein n=1 Tax=marine sediment metagenome TaxID=412755 RepID=A0A0F9SXU9_9ZZZZ
MQVKDVNNLSAILTSNIDESEKVYKNNEVILRKARFIYQYSEFDSYFDKK